jgi:hypothetical protein
MEFAGFAAAYNVWTPFGDDRWRRFAPGCFDGGLGGPAALIFNHDDTSRVWSHCGPLASTTDLTLAVRE